MPPIRRFEASVSYRDRIEPALTGLPASARATAEGSAEGTRVVAQAIGRPDLAAAADHTYLHSMYVTSAVAAVVTALGVVMILIFFRPAKN